MRPRTSSGKAFPERLLRDGVGVNVTRARHDLPPAVAVQETVQVVVRDDMADARLDVGEQFRSGNEASCSGPPS